MKLRPYHNPEGVDESKVPDGWRFRYADEYPTCVRVTTPCCAWGVDGRVAGRFSHEDDYAGNSRRLTYIVPVTP
jgi:hypothetical protein